MDDIRVIKRTLLRVAIVALCITALIAIVAVVSASFDETEGRILATHVAVAVYSLLALAIATAAQRLPRLTAAGFATCAVGLALAVVAIWSDWTSDNLVRWVFIVFVVAFTVAHGALIESRRREPDGPFVRALSTATIATGALLGVLLAIGIGVAEDVSSAYLRLLGVLAVLDLLGTTVLPIARKIEQASPDR